MAEKRYIIGVDLGTTNTALSYVDTRSADPRPRLFEIPQLVAPGEIARRRQLPSFVYTPGEHDLGPAETALPWAPERRYVVGELARAQGARMPSRMISSAKSWLCHGGVDRKAAILPWGVEGGEKLSPVEASALVLAHLRDAWDHEHANAPGAAFVDQEIMVTVPASFDEAARELTLEAAERAGYPPVVPLEEPQAAFYAWIDSHAGARRDLLGPGSRVLVFDVGGGTTDFTLISVDREGEGFERTAVGDHLLLGGDNLDLTLAKQVEARANRKLDPLQWHALVHACRLAKETLLAGDDDRAPIAVAGRSSKLIGGTLRDEIGREELEKTVDGGFFPDVGSGAAPSRARGGLQEFGLPFASDPGITRHLASFLTRHHAGAIDAVLFNGGAMTPERLRRRMLDQIGAWQPERGAPSELKNELPELAVAKGAAYYGLVRRGLGARIRGGTPRSYYVGVQAEDGEMAVCLAPKGLEEGSRVELDRDFELVTNRPVSFKLYSSSTRDDPPGALVSPDEAGDDLLELPPIVTVLRAPGRSRATVHLEVRITELGALEISCRDRSGETDDKWRLSFDMRAGGATQADEAEDKEADPHIEEAVELVRAAYRGGQSVTPQRLVKEIERTLGARRDEWTMSRTRRLFDAAFEVEEERHKTAEHEARWLNLTGFCLRPGTGAPLDEWRSKQMWRIFNQGMRHDRSEAVRLAWWIAWRRIAGGLRQGHQEQIYDRLAQLFLPGPKQKKKWFEYKPTKQEAAEMWRTLANLERLTPQHKQKLGDQLVERLASSKKNREDALYFWALGRLGSRVPLYGPLNCVVPAQAASAWIETLLELDWPAPDKAAFPVAQLGRRTGDRSRDIDEDVRARLAARLKELPGGDRTARLVEETVALEAREERVALGDTLPAGLRLVTDEQGDTPSSE